MYAETFLKQFDATMLERQNATERRKSRLEAITPPSASDTPQYILNHTRSLMTSTQAQQLITAPTIVHKKVIHEPGGPGTKCLKGWHVNFKHSGMTEQLLLNLPQESSGWVTLLSEITVYYTLDGSSPLTSQSRVRYRKSGEWDGVASVEHGLSLSKSCLLRAVATLEMPGSAIAASLEKKTSGYVGGARRNQYTGYASVVVKHLYKVEGVDDQLPSLGKPMTPVAAPINPQDVPTPLHVMTPPDRTNERTAAGGKESIPLLHSGTAKTSSDCSSAVGLNDVDVTNLDGLGKAPSTPHSFRSKEFSARPISPSPPQ
jgi:hypothetical protein